MPAQTFQEHQATSITQTRQATYLHLNEGEYKDSNLEDIIVIHHICALDIVLFTLINLELGNDKSWLWYNTNKIYFMTKYPKMLEDADSHAWCNSVG